MTVTDLDQFQSWMQKVLINSSDTSVQTAGTKIAASSRQSPQARLAIYQRSYYARLLKCMREQFPALCYALGERLFNDFSLEYLRKNPSQSYTLYELGSRFPSYLAGSRPDKNSSVKEAWITFMVELATFERQLFVLFDEPGAEGMISASEETDDQHLQLQPAIKLGHFSFPVMDFYQAVRRKEEPELPPFQPVSLMMVRKNYQTHILSLTKAHYVFLQAMQSGMDVSGALQHTAISLNLSLERVTRSWQHRDGVRNRWLSFGVFVELNI
ncbi:DNA-binding domain-containing protein [Endozoicomonas lisbonensis]|uniref:Putative DNA-binding domain-containing protein n=1 Tax=Endozoicomonas lisbonensis TaxID=3120522 RepID=A0ABV2SCU4_9GAMM